MSISLCTTKQNTKKENISLYTVCSVSLMKKILINHKENCRTINGAQTIKMPRSDDMVYFKNYHKGLAAPFAIYAYFEAFNEKVHGCQPNNDKSYTESYQKHKVCGYGYNVVCCYDNKYSKPVQIYRGENAVHKFMEKMFKEVEWWIKMKYKHFNKDMILTKDYLHGSPDLIINNLQKHYTGFATEFKNPK